MSSLEHDVVVHRVLNNRTGSVVAAAGCGKTEAIVMVAGATVAAHHSGTMRKPLILTHTNAGVAALRARLKSHGVPDSRVCLDTIAGWSQRFALAYPATSGCVIKKPAGKQWTEIYLAAARLVQSGAVDRVLQASYARVLVDEYQDCGGEQHELCLALRRLLPVCVFGDPMQSIFDFDGRLIDWGTEVTPNFPQIGTLVKPWRWVKAGNEDHATWLEGVRTRLETGQPIILSKPTPTCSHTVLPSERGHRQAVVRNACYEVLRRDGKVVLIASGKAEGTRVGFAEKLAKLGFTVIEPLDSKSLLVAAKKLDKANDSKRLSAALDFLGSCMVGLERSEFETAVTSRMSGRKAGQKKFGGLIDLGVAVGLADGRDKFMSLFLGFRKREGVDCYRREMFAAMLAAIKSVQIGESSSLEEAIGSTVSRSHHLGRIIPHRGIGSTLLVKGLEFEHAIIVEYPGMTKADWYVALTRATKTVTVLSASPTINPV